jgi:poly(rC)-binding protein 2/3/4
MLGVIGVADAIQIAIYYIGNILIEAEERMPSSANSSYFPSTNSRRQPPTHSGPSSLGRTNSTRSFSSLTSDELKTIIDSRFPRLVGATAQALIH